MSEWEAPQTVGAHIGSNTDAQDLVREFDDTMTAVVDGRYKRSDEILESMRWRVAFEQIFAAKGFGDLDSAVKRRAVEQALRDHLDAELADG